MRPLLFLLLLCGCSDQSTVRPPDNTSVDQSSKTRLSKAEQLYLECAKTEAGAVGTTQSISAEQAAEIVSRCKHLLGEAASERVARAQGAPMTNLPSGLETPNSRIAVAMQDIEHQAKMSISEHVPPLPVR